MTDLETFLSRKRFIKNSILDLSTVHDVELLIDELSTKTGLFGIFQKRNSKYVFTLDLYRGYLLEHQKGSPPQEMPLRELTRAPIEESVQDMRSPAGGEDADTGSTAKGKRSYTSADANRLLAEHRILRNALYEIDEADQTYTGDIKKASEALQKRAVRDVLDGIPIEEINRDKSGFRI